MKENVMTASRTRSSRRAFLAQGGAALSAGVAATAGAAAPKSDDAKSRNDELEQLRRQVALVEDREAIRRLHMTFTSLIGSQRYETAAELFDERAWLQLSGVSAAGRQAIEQLFAEQYRCQRAATLHSAYRQSGLQQDAVTVSDDHLRASATFPVDVELSSPLQGDSTIVEMARLQGHVADRRWEAGRFEATYVKTAGQWMVASLDYHAS
jgi:hypothetical protein